MWIGGGLKGDETEIKHWYGIMGLTSFSPLLSYVIIKKRKGLIYERKNLELGSKTNTIYQDINLRFTSHSTKF